MGQKKKVEKFLAKAIVCNHFEHPISCDPTSITIKWEKTHMAHELGYSRPNSIFFMVQ